MWPTTKPIVVIQMWAYKCCYEHHITNLRLSSVLNRVHCVTRESSRRRERERKGEREPQNTTKFHSMFLIQCVRICECAYNRYQFIWKIKRRKKNNCKKYWDEFCTLNTTRRLSIGTSIKMYKVFTGKNFALDIFLQKTRVICIKFSPQIEILFDHHAFNR